MVTVIALRMSSVGYASHRLHFLFFFNFLFLYYLLFILFYFYFFYYFTWNAKRLSRRAGLLAIAEFLGCITTKLSW